MADSKFVQKLSGIRYALALLGSLRYRTVRNVGGIRYVPSPLGSFRCRTVRNVGL